MRAIAETGRMPSNKGFAELAGLDGLFALNVDDRKLAMNAAGLAAIVNLPNLGWLAYDATDDAMPHIAAMSKLRFLMCQDTIAGDDGFVALARLPRLRTLKITGPKVTSACVSAFAPHVDTQFTD